MEKLDTFDIVMNILENVGMSVMHRFIIHYSRIVSFNVRYREPVQTQLSYSLELSISLRETAPALDCAWHRYPKQAFESNVYKMLILSWCSVISFDVDFLVFEF